MDDITKQSQRETEPAFPLYNSDAETGQMVLLRTGLSIRDYFAAAALTGLAAANMPTCAYKADIAFDLADAMLAERERRTNQPQAGVGATQDESPTPPAAPNTGIELIVQERQQQITEKGFDAAHDDRHRDGSILRCAVEVLRPSQEMRDFEDGKVQFWGPHAWPFGRARHIRKKYSDNRVHQLVIAGALIAAEIDRLNRAEGK